MPGGVPRSVNFVTGPSRTADIAQKLELGAHGPKRLLILIVERAARLSERGHEPAARARATPDELALWHHVDARRGAAAPERRAAAPPPAPADRRRRRAGRAGRSGRARRAGRRAARSTRSGPVDLDRRSWLQACGAATIRSTPASTCTA